MKVVPQSGIRDSTAMNQKTKKDQKKRSWLSHSALFYESKEVM